MPNEQLQTYTLRVPTSVGLSSRKEWILNLNNYRNAHYMILNKAKVNFKNLVSLDIHKLPKFSTIDTIEYTLYRDTKRHCDIANICSIVDKFFCDALVEFGKLPDDNFNYLRNVSYRWGGILSDKTESYVEITLKGITDMQLVSKISLNKAELETAVKEFVSKAYPTFAEAVAKASISFDKDFNCDLNLDASSNKSESLRGNRKSSGVHGTGSIQDKQPERQTEPAATDGEAEKPAVESSATPSEPEPEAKPEQSMAAAVKSDSKPAKSSVFGRTKKPADTTDGGEHTESNPDNQGTSDTMEVVEEPAMEPEVTENTAEISNSIFGKKTDHSTPASGIGASIFGRKKVA